MLKEEGSGDVLIDLCCDRHVNLEEIASNLRAMASKLGAMASTMNMSLLTSSPP